MFETLAHRIQESRRMQARKGVSPQVRRDVIRAVSPLVDDGHSVRELAKALNVSTSTLYRWLRESCSRQGFRPVTLSAAPSTTAASTTAASTAPPPPPASYRMTSPAGYVVEGLSLDEVTTFLRVLR